MEKGRDLRIRTKQFALRIVRLYASLPKTTEAQVMGKQALRSGASVGAHYREAARARSTAEFISKLGVALQELDETVYWLDLLAESGILASRSLADLMAEADELIALFVASIKTAKQRSPRRSDALRESPPEYLVSPPPASSFMVPPSSLLIPPSSLQVTVFGGARVAADSPLYADCLTLGRLLAEAGYAVATGGYTGVMEAVLQGAAEAGGHAIGYTCATFAADFQPNPWVAEERTTTLLTTRIQRMAEESDAFVAVHGGIGTLAELALVWNMILAGEIRPQPLVVVGADWGRVLDSLYARTQLGSSALKLLTLVDTPQAAVQALVAAHSRLAGPAAG